MAAVPRPRILIVDDDELLRRTLVRLLAASFDVVQARNGAEAIELLRGESFDAVLTDLEMPEVGGDGIVRWLEENQAEMARRLVVMTGGAKRADQSAWLRSFDADRVVRKPYTRNEIMAALDRILPKGTS